jgi:hypothetical protein
MIFNPLNSYKFFMSSFHPRGTPTAELLPCPECGGMALESVLEAVTLHDGTKVSCLAHKKCRDCQARFFDDLAIHAIQEKREKNRKPLKKVA